MRTAKHSTLLIAITLGSVFGLSLGEPLQGQDTRSEILTAFKAGIANDAQYESVSNFIKPSGQEVKWREIPWIPSIWEGIKIAEKKRKPIFVWAMNGDPLGCV